MIEHNGTSISFLVPVFHSQLQVSGRSNFIGNLNKSRHSGVTRVWYHDHAILLALMYTYLCSETRISRFTCCSRKWHESGRLVAIVTKGWGGFLKIMKTWKRNYEHNFHLQQLFFMHLNINMLKRRLAGTTLRVVKLLLWNYYYYFKSCRSLLLLPQKLPINITITISNSLTTLTTLFCCVIYHWWLSRYEFCCFSYSKQPSTVSIHSVSGPKA